jgi:glycine cleavage system aminomethyltransferase T
MQSNNGNKREVSMLSDEINVIRTATAISDANHVAVVRLSGEGAFDVLDRTCSCDLYLQDAQMRFALLLEENGNTLADIYVCRDDEDYLVLAEGVSRETLVDVFRHADKRVDVRDLGEEYDLVSLHGPFAWEFLAEFAGPDVIGLPYLSLFHLDEMICFRGGKTGDYGYDLLLPKKDSASIREKMFEVGAAFDLKQVSLEAVDQCSFENWFFNARKEGQLGLGPLELGLQWRVSYGKEYVGSTALAARRKEGMKQRTTCALSRTLLLPGATVVTKQGENIGRVLRSEHSPTIDAYVNMVLLDTAFAYSGIDSYVVTAQGAAAIQILTVSPPVINNRSLYVNAQKHSYATRETHAFPPLT